MREGADQGEPTGRLLFLGAYPDKPRSRQVAEDLAGRLSPQWQSVLVSSRKTPLGRLIDQARATGSLAPDVAVIDLFGSRAFWPASAWTRWFRRRGVPTVLHLHGGSLPELARRHPRWTRATLACARRVVAPSAYLARELSPLRSGIEVIPNAIDVARYRREGTSPTGPLQLLWLRTFHPLYDPLLAIEAVRQVLAEGENVHLRMIGPTTDQACLQQVRRCAAELPADRVEILGSIEKSEVAAQMKRADVFLNTSRVDNTPVTVVEALAAGCAVVSTRVGGVPDLVADGSTGILTAPRDATELARHLIRLARDPVLRDGLAAAGEAAAAAFDWAATLPQWHRLFADLSRQGAAT